MRDLLSLGAGSLRDAIVDGQISAVEAVDAYLDRIAECNPALNALVQIFDHRARLDAAEADRRRLAGEPLGALHGVPFTIKDNIDVGGVPTSWGVSALSAAIAAQDAPVVQRMRAAGGIAIGKTNLPDMALRVHTDSSLHGATINPWNPGRTPGGSSGGEAVALATGMSALGLGNDIGGSLRNPANACGIASIKPTAGRVPDASLVPSEDRLLVAQLMNVQGPMARRVSDLRLALDVIQGAHPRDPWAISLPSRGASIDGPIRVAVVPKPPGGSVHPSVAVAVRRAAGHLSDAGYEVHEICPPCYDEAFEVATRLLMGDFASVLDGLAPLMGEAGLRFLSAYREDTLPVTSAADMSALLVQRDRIARAWSMFMADYPLMLSPTWADLPFEVGFDVSSASASAATKRMTRPVLPANLLGLPSACVPVMIDEKVGLPIGVLVTGVRFRDDLCLDAAEVIEMASDVQTPLNPRSFPVLNHLEKA